MYQVPIAPKNDYSSFEKYNSYENPKEYERDEFTLKGLYNIIDKYDNEKSHYRRNTTITDYDKYDKYNDKYSKYDNKYSKYDK